MAEYIVEERDTGLVVYAYTADKASDFPEFPFSLYNHVLKKPEVMPPVQRIITKLEYLRRFTTTERVAIRAAASASPVLDDYLKLMELAQEINLDDLDTIAAANMLETVGLIGEGRAAEILA